MSKTRPYTPKEKALARRLFEDAHAKGMLKLPSGLGAVGLSNRPGWSASSRVTEADYRRDARKLLEGRQPRRPGPRRITGKKVSPKS